MNKRYMNIILLISIIFIGMIGYRMFNKPPVQTTSTTTKLTSITYHNTQYGFDFKLPLTWKGYSIIESTRDGFLSDAQGKLQETIKIPQISIRHPLWTSENPYQDIPIVILTLNQWPLTQEPGEGSGSLSISAAPIGPSKLGENSNYAFALPPRYNFAFETNWEEVEAILKTNPLQGF